MADDIVTRLHDWQDYNDGERLISPSYALSLTLQDAAAEIERLRAAGDALHAAVRNHNLTEAHLRAWEEARRG